VGSREKWLCISYIHPTLMDATAKQRSSSMHGTSWLQSSVLAVGLDVAPAAPVG